MIRKFKKLVLALSSLSIFILVHPRTVEAALVDFTKIQGCVTQVDVNGSPVRGILSLGCLAGIVTAVIAIAFMFLGAVAIIFFLVGSIKFILSGGNEKSVKAAKDMITYAVIGTFLVVLTFFLIRVVIGTFGLPDILSSFTFYQQWP